MKRISIAGICAAGTRADPGSHAPDQPIASQATHHRRRPRAAGHHRTRRVRHPATGGCALEWLKWLEGKKV